MDDSESMRRYWKDVELTLDLLIYLVKKQDPNEVDLLLTNSDAHYKSKKTTELLRPIHRHQPRGVTNMEASLAKALQKHKAQFRKGELGQPATLYVLTDGGWQWGDPATPIGELVDDLRKLGAHEHFGIEFIRFGDDPAAEAKLNALDTLPTEW